MQSPTNFKTYLLYLPYNRSLRRDKATGAYGVYINNTKHPGPEIASRTNDGIQNGDQRKR